MQIVYYRNTKHTEREMQVIDRASHKKHLQKKLILWDILLFLTVGILGVLMHLWAPLFVSVPILNTLFPSNESIWEHLKLLFFPAILTAVIRRTATGKLQHGILTTFAEGLLLSMLLMIAGFYTYSGILGTHDLRIDIGLFYLCTLVLTLYVHFRSSGQKKSSLPGLVILLLLTGCFYYFTLYPPNLGLFREISQSLQ